MVGMHLEQGCGFLVVMWDSQLGHRHGALEQGGGEGEHTPGAGVWA